MSYQIKTTNIMKQGEDPTLSINEIFSLICPEGKSEYVSKLIEIVTGYPTFEDQIKDLKRIMVSDFGVDSEKLTNLTSLQVVQVYNNLTAFDTDDVAAYQKVCKSHLNGEITDEEFLGLQDLRSVSEFSKNLKNGQ